MPIACATWGHLVTARAVLAGGWGVRAEPAVVRSEGNEVDAVPAAFTAL